MIIHVIDGGRVVNSIVAPEGTDPVQYGGIAADELPLGVGIGWAFDGTNWTAPAMPETTLDDLRAAKIAAISATTEALLAAGAPADGGLHIALDDGSRADLTAMAATATAAASGAVAWPESYSRGWITIENVRIPLATPVTGLTLAAKAGDFYAAVVQHRRDLKDAALAAVDASTLGAIDVEAGWPG